MTRRKIIPYNADLKEKARNLRNNSTLSEVSLWNRLKRRQLIGYQFLRQKPLDNYIVDFFCSRLILAIEIDGDSHIDKENVDLKRQDKLESLGITFFRFPDNEVKKNLDGALQTIANWIEHFELRLKQ